MCFFVTFDHRATDGGLGVPETIRERAFIGRLWRHLRGPLTTYTAKHALVHLHIITQHKIHVGPPKNTMINGSKYHSMSKISWISRRQISLFENGHRFKKGQANIKHHVTTFDPQFNSKHLSPSTISPTRAQH